MAFADLSQSLLVSLYTASVVDRLPILVEHGQGVDVVALPLGLRASGQSELYRLCALLQLIWRRRRPYRVIPGSGHAPISHATGRVGFGGFIECHARFLIAERMQQSRSAGNR